MMTRAATLRLLLRTGIRITAARRHRRRVTRFYELRPAGSFENRVRKARRGIPCFPEERSPVGSRLAVSAEKLGGK